MLAHNLKEITLEDLANLIDDQVFLAALFEAGVEDWEGFEKAEEIYEFIVEEQIANDTSDTA